MDIEREAARQELLSTAKAAARDQLKPLATALGAPGASVATAIENAVFAFVNVMTGGEPPVEHVDQPLEVAPLVSGSDHIPEEHLVAATTLPPVVEADPIEAVSETALPVSTEVEPAEVPPEIAPLTDSVILANDPGASAPAVEPDAPVIAAVDHPHGDPLDPSDVDGCGFCGAVPPTPYHAVNCARPQPQS